MSDEENRTFLEIIVPDSLADIQHVHDALGSAAAYVDRLDSEMGRTCAFKIRHLDDLQQLPVMLLGNTPGLSFRAQREIPGDSSPRLEACPERSRRDSATFGMTGRRSVPSKNNDGPSRHLQASAKTGIAHAPAGANLLCWELDFEVPPSSVLLSAVLGDAIEKWRPKVIALRLKDKIDDEVRRTLFILKTILSSLDRSPIGLRLVSCPTCARCKANLMTYAQQVEARLKDRSGNLVVAVMGCEVNGPGEAKAADVGIAFGQGAGLIFRKGEKLRKVAAEQAVDALMEEVDDLLQYQPKEEFSI